MCFNRIQSLENLKLKKTKLSPASKIFRALPHSEGFVLAAQVNGEYFHHFAKTRKILTTAFTSSHILLLEDERKNWKKGRKKLDKEDDASDRGGDGDDADRNNVDVLP